MKKDCLTTFSKVDFNTFEPEEDKIRIEDIAHALSMMTRANGHFPQFFSVGQHCIQCCHEATARNYLPQTALACLLHDGSEAYLADITRPVKKNMTISVPREHPVSVPCRPRSNRKDHSGTSEIHRRLPPVPQYFQYSG